MADTVISNDGHKKAADMAVKLAEANKAKFAAEDKYDALVTGLKTFAEGNYSFPDAFYLFVEEL